MKQAARIDANQPDIVKHLRAIGCSVQSLAAVGHGVPDLLVGRRAICVLIEVKDPAQAPSKRKLTTDQVEWHKLWKGQVGVAHTPAEAEAIVCAAEKWAAGEMK